MTLDDISERLIQAAEIDRRSEVHVGPARLKSMNLPYAYSQADKNGWGSERLAEERKEFWDSLSRRPSARQISEADEAWGWLALISDDKFRDALAGWAWCMAGGGHFNRWCRARNMHENTGRRRKNRALVEIEREMSRRTVLHNGNGASRVLPDAADLGYYDDTLEEPVSDLRRVLVWRDEATRPMDIPELRDFSWAAKRNEMRRQREARKRQREAA